MNAEFLATILGIAAAAVSGIVGSFALMKKMTLAGDVVSHLTLPGLGLAFLWGWNPLIGAAATLALGLVIIHQLQGRGGLATETAIGVVFIGALAIGTLITPAEDLIDALFGGFENVTPIGFLIGMDACAAVLITMYVFRHQLILITFSPDLAASLGINVSRVNLIYLAAFGVTILVGLQFLGALLVGAMIIVPAATGRHLAKTLDQFLLLSSAASILSVACGFGIASQWHFPLGPTIVAAASALFLVALVIGHKQPVIRDAARPAALTHS